MSGYYKDDMGMKGGAMYKKGGSVKKKKQGYKDRKEDMESISEGIIGQKGDVHLSIGNIINFESDSYDDCSDLITKAIKDSYKPHATNYAAAIIQGKEDLKSINDLDKIDEAILYLENRIKLIPEDMHPYLLNQYSNPVL